MNLDMSECVSIHTAVLIWTDLRRGFFLFARECVLCTRWMVDINIPSQCGWEMSIHFALSALFLVNEHTFSVLLLLQLIRNGE